MDCLHRLQVASGAMCEDTGQGCAACAAAASNVAMLSCFNSFGVETAEQVLSCQPGNWT